MCNKNHPNDKFGQKAPMYMKIKTYFVTSNLTNLVTLPLFLILIFLIHKLFLIANLPFSADEAYHWEWSRHLSLSYYDHPPMTAWLISIFTKVLGTSRFVVRLTAFFCYIVSLVFTYKLGIKISGKKAAFLSVFVFASIPIFSAMSVMITTDPPLLMFWSASLYYIYKAIFEKEKFWIAAGLAVGGAMLCKFLAFNILFSLAAFLILSGKLLTTLKSKYFYFFLLIVFLVFSPVLYWNYHNEWATFYFNFSKRHTFKFRYKYIFDYILVQFVVSGLSTFVLMLLASFSSIKSFSFYKEKEKLFLFIFGILIFISFLPVSFSRRIGAHWPICGYLSFSVITGIWISTLKRKLIPYIALSFPIFLTIILSFFLLFTHLIPDNLSYTAQKKATTKRLVHFYGWEEAADHLNLLLNQMPEDSRIISDSYGVASLMALYSQRNVYSHVLNLYGIHGLNYYFWDAFEKTKGINGIYVIATKGKKARISKGRLKHLRRAFEKYEVLAPLKIFVNNKHVRNFLFVKCYNLIKPLSEKNPI